MYVYTTSCEKFTICCEAMNNNLRSDFFYSRIFSIALQVLRTFIYPNVPILSDVLPDPHPPRKLFFIGAEESWVRVGLPKFAKQYYQKLRSNIAKSCEAILPKVAKQYCQKLRSNIAKICEAIYPKFAKQYDQNLRSNMTNICEANHTLWAVPVRLAAAAHVRRADEEPLEGWP